jgi:hypothetical protein
MINSTSSQQGTPSTVAPIGLSQPGGAARPDASPSDTLSTAGSEFLKAKLGGEPEIRPEMLARGQALAADPSYPSAEILGKVAGMLLQSPDPSEDLS